MMAESTVQFLRRGRVVPHTVPNPMQTVLDYLRLDEKSKGTKEGCNEGDCGACTVTIGSLKHGKLVFEPANACILLMGQLDGKELITVDDLAVDGTLHAVQQAMVDLHGSQCGFCTPGIVMSLFTLFHSAETVTRQGIEDALAGNLCRCTGYRPIIDAAFKALHGARTDSFTARRADTISTLQALTARGDVFAGDARSFVAVPKSEEELLRLADVHKDAVIVSGATDVGLWITKQLRVMPKLIFTHGVEALHHMVDHGDHLTIGAAATYAEATSMLAAVHADIGETIRRIGSVQVRASGTIGGNIANGSPIGDTPPLLIALGATLVLRSAQGERRLPLEDFFVAYGKQDRKAGELVWAIDVPKLKAQEHFCAYKISKRFDQDISAIMAAFRFTIDGKRISSARLAFGGMAATPKCAARTEAALAGAAVNDPRSWQAAIIALAEDFQPLTDMRASASYRLTVAQNLLRKALLEQSGEDQPTRVLELA
jgi:xanthine dehydrogenase small subunit